MANNNQPRVGILLTAIILSNNLLRVTARVERGNQSPQGLLVQFFLNGVAIPGAQVETDAHGIAFYDFQIPDEATSAKVKAETLIGGNIVYKENIFNVSEASPGQSRSSLPVLVIEETKLTANKSRYTMGLFNARGEMVAGALQLSSSKPITISFPFPADQVNNALAAGLQTPNGDAHEITIDGPRWLSVDITFHDGFELDVFVVGWRVKLELNIDAPAVEKAEQIPQTRTIFAAFCIFVFCIGLFTTSTLGFLGEFPVTVILAAIVSGLFGYFCYQSVSNYNLRVRRNSHLNIIPTHYFLSMFVGTNNVWLLSMILMVVMMAALLVLAPWGTPLLLEDTRDAMSEQQRKQERGVFDNAQRYRNKQKNIGLVTDKELESRKPYVSWESFWVRLGALIFLTCLLMYVFVAYKDEAVKAGHAVIVWFRGKSHVTEGDTGEQQGFFSKLLSKLSPAPQAPPVSADDAQATPAPQQGGWMKTIIATLGASAVMELIFEVGERVFGRLMRKDGDNRRRYES